MLKKIGLPLILGTAFAVLIPVAAHARDYDRDRDHERHERHEWREHEWREHHPRFRAYFSYGPTYANGYYDRWGYWHPYGGGYYDRWGYFHPYR